MTFLEKRPEKPALHNKELHELVLSYLKDYAPGFVLDLPSGPGYLLRELKKRGFNGVAGEIDENLHFFQDIEYKKIDMSQKISFENNTFNYIVSLEGIEHIENHFSFIREISRILKPNGLFIMTTPNIHSLESRFKFFFSGFHSLLYKPIPVDSENVYFEHINPISLESICFICKKENLKVVQLITPRYRKGSLMLYYILYPFLYMATYKTCFINEKDPKRKLANKALFKLLISKENLTGSHTVIIAKK